MHPSAQLNEETHFLFCTIMWWSQFPHYHKKEACMCGLVVFVSTLCFYVHLHVACVNPFNICSRKTWCNECQNWSQIKKLSVIFFMSCVCCEHYHYCDNCLIHLQYFGSFVSRRKWSLMLSLICQILRFIWIFRLCVWLQILQESCYDNFKYTLRFSLTETGNRKRRWDTTALKDMGGIYIWPTAVTTKLIGIVGICGCYVKCATVIVL